MQIRLPAQPIQGFPEASRQCIGRQIGVPLHLRLGHDLVLDAQVAAGQSHGHGHVGVGVGANDPVFHTPRRRAGDRGTDADRTVVIAPLDVDGRRRIATQAAVAVHVRGHQHHGRRNVALQPADVVHEHLGRRAIRVAEHVLSTGNVHQTLVHVHGTARLARNRFGHEGRVHIVAQRRLAHRAFEEEHLVCQPQRLVVEKVDFHLPCAHLVDEGVHIELHLVAVVVDFFKQRVKFIDGINAVGLARCLGPAAAANGGLQQGVGVGVARRQVKLQLRRHNGLQALGGKQIAHFAQDAARRKGHQIARVVKAVMNHLRRGVRGPGHDAHG